MELKKEIQIICDSILKKKGDDLKVLDIKEISSIADYFVLASVKNRRQSQAAADEIEEQLKKENVHPLRKEGYREGDWILMDFGSIIVHIFTEEERRRYELDRLWNDARPEAYDGSSSDKQ